VAWDMIGKGQPEQFISHRMPLSGAAEAYRLLDQTPEQALQLVFDYNG